MIGRKGVGNVRPFTTRRSIRQLGRQRDSGSSSSRMKIRLAVAVASALIAQIAFVLLPANPSEAGGLSGPGVLAVGVQLSANQSINSPGGSFKLVMQGDGNLVEYQGSSALWASGTSGSGDSLVMQGDGNLVLYNSLNQPQWASNTSGNPGAALTLGDNGVLSVQSVSGTPLWIPPPSVTSVSPASGPTSGGTVVTITGTGLGQA